MRQKYLLLLVAIFFITYLTISHVNYPPIVYDYDRLEKDTEIKPLPMVNCLGSNSNEERYMTYLPHSGFHNQRISLENAIFLSWVLNRTLIIPPILFAKHKFIPHRRFDLLYNMLNGNLTNNAQACKKKGVEDPACMFTQLDWEELMNFEFVKKNIRYIYRKDLTFDQRELYSYLNITKPKSQVYTLAEETRYDFQFYDDASITQVSDPQFRYLVHICSLQRREEKLIHFGSVYSLVRLNLKYRENIEFYNAVKENMIINHPVLIEIGERIAEQLGGLGGYVGVHLRLGDNGLDKKFGERAKENVDNTIREVSKRIEAPVTAPLDVVDALVPTETMIDAEKCIQSIPPEQRHIPIIYLASDKPRKDIRLRRFFREFPCVFMLITNFSKYLDRLRTVKNPRDGALLYRYFLPMVDGIVAAGGGEFYGTPDSTFTDYVYRLHVRWVGS